jgi:drug/metabolite transporter (DMT)-like permease
LIRLSWIVFVYAVLLSIESIAVEFLTTQLNVTPLAVAATSSLISGAVLMSISLLKDKKQSFSIFKGWKLLLPAALFVAVGFFTMFDSVSAVGASKVVLLAGPLETVVIVILAALFLHEKLTSIQKMGICVAMVGFVVALLSGITGFTFSPDLKWGDAEAALSAIFLGIGIVFITKMTENYTTLTVTASLLLISGGILIAALWATGSTEIAFGDWGILLAFSILPLVGTLCYVAGLSKVGASITSVIASFSILLTVVFQLALFGINVEVLLPANVPIAICGGILAILGVYLMHKIDSRNPLIRQ